MAQNSRHQWQGLALSCGAAHQRTRKQSLAIFDFTCYILTVMKNNTSLYLNQSVFAALQSFQNSSCKIKHENL